MLIATSYICVCVVAAQAARDAAAREAAEREAIERAEQVEREREAAIWAERERQTKAAGKAVV